MGNKHDPAGGIAMSTSSSQPTSASSQRGRQVDAKHGGVVDIAPADRERFEALAKRWWEETALHSNSALKNAHPALQEIISMGQSVTPLILERMRAHGGHWFEALRQITGADPVSPADYGNIAAMQDSWLQWGERNGYV